MNLANTRALLLCSLVVLFAFGVAACSSPDGTPDPSPTATPKDTSRHFKTTSFMGYQATIDIDSANAMSFTLSQLDPVTALSKLLAVVTGHCQAPAPSTGIITCSASSSTAPSVIASDQTIRLLEVPGTALYLKLEPAAAANVIESHLSGAIALVQAGTTCGNMDGDYSYFEDNYISFGLHRFDIAHDEFRDLDFRMNPSGASFTSSYLTTLGGGNGIHNLLSSQCFGALRLLSINDLGWVPKLGAMTSDSGLVQLVTQTSVPKSRMVGLSALVGKSFRGVQKTNAGDAIPVSFDFGAIGADASISVTNFNYGSGAALDASFVGLKLIAASGSAAGTRFAEHVASNNALSADYATASAVPGLLYSNTTVVTGEQPALAYAWTTTSGKTGILVMTTQRDTVVGVVAGYTLTTAIEE